MLRIWGGPVSLLALVLVAGACTNEGTTTSATAPTTTTYATAPTTTTYAAMVAFDLSSWTRVSDEGGVFGGESFEDERIFGDEGVRVGMESVASGGSGLVAVGNAVDLNGVVWTSSNGTSWLPVPDPDDVFSLHAMHSVTKGGPGFVAVGSSGAFAAVWTSPDGLEWSLVPLDPGVFAGEGLLEMWSVTEGGPGLVVVGKELSPVAGCDPAQGCAATTHGAVWTSPDGFVWSRVPHDAAVFGGEDKNQSMNSVVAGGPGLVAVGEELTFSVDDGDAAVWTSPDGINWARVPHDEAVFGGEGFQEMSSVVAGGDGVVAVGDDGSPAAVWTSPDGLAWTQVPHEGVFGGVAKMVSVTVVGQDLVAVGFAVVDGDQDAAVWSSPDGITWIRIAHEESLFGGEDAQRMLSVTASSSGIVAVGDEQVPPDSFAAVWVASHER